MTRAVISGGAGFIGSHLGERLLERGVDVLCIDNFVTGSVRNVAHLLDRPGFELLEQDVSEPFSVAGPVDYVLHFASPASPVDYARLPVETLRVGSQGTHHLLDLARTKSARFLLASTSEVYGDPLVHPQPETYWGNVNPVGPRACYDEGKRYAESLTHVYRTEHGLDTAIIRIFNTFGPRMRPGDGRAVPTFVHQAMTGAPLTVHGDGSQTRSLCYVDDLVDAVLRMLFSDLPGPVNLGSPEEVTVRELADLVRQAVGTSSSVEFAPRPADDPSLRRPDIALARTELGWEPRVSLRDGLARTVQWFRESTAESAAVESVPSDPLTMVVVGTGYVGAVTAIGMAWLGHEVWGLDRDPTQVGQLNGGQAPFHEPGLSDLLGASLDTGRLRFTDDPAQALAAADFVFLCVGTPPDPTGVPDLSQLESAIVSLAPHLRPDAVLVNKSTVPVGSGNWTRMIVEDALGDEAQVVFHVVSNPEFLREGSAIEDFLHPDRVVLGGSGVGVDRVAELYAPILEQSFVGGRRTARPELITTDIASAEMIKYAANAFLATKISFANEIAQLSELVGADVRHVLPAIGADHRVGRSFLAPGVGWGGSCFGKDVAALVATGQEYGYRAAMLEATVAINERQRAAVVRKLQGELRVLKGRRIALLGLTFKPGTDDLRDSPALDIASRLLAGGASVSAYDPVVKRLPSALDAVRLGSDAYDAATRVDAVVLITEWPELVELDPHALAEVMRGDVVIDGRNAYPQGPFGAAGLRLVGFGW